MPRGPSEIQWKRERKTLSSNGSMKALISKRTENPASATRPSAQENCVVREKMPKNEPIVKRSK